jgi:hypothetical protein
MSTPFPHRPTTRWGNPRRRPRTVVARATVKPAARPMALLGLAIAGALAGMTLLSSAASAQGWQLQQIEQGTKPALSLTPEGDPVVVYMLERQDGWVRIATLVDDVWQIDEIASGYFYGPPDIAIGPDGIGHATYHDHQDQQFRPEKGDAVYVRGEDGTWTSTIAADPGHDGWDNRITVDAAGRPHMVAVDPLEFEGSGVEYYSVDDEGVWSAEAIGSGPQTYKYAVSVAVDGEGTPWVSYHDGAESSLNLAHPTSDGWEIEVVDGDGDTGFFNESAIDASGGLHISYYERQGETSGVVKHAYRAQPGDDWRISEVDALDAVSTGFTGARNITSIDLDSEGIPAIVYADESVMKFARLADGEWQTEVVVEAGDIPLGQIVSLELDVEGRPHIAYADVTDRDQLDGTIWYATRG